MGFLDRIKNRPAQDQPSIRHMLEARGATAEEAQEILDTLGRRLSPDKVQVWLSHPKKSHPIPDPDAAKGLEEAGLVPVPMNWTPINAISAGRTHLVIDEARRYVGK